MRPEGQHSWRAVMRETGRVVGGVRAFDCEVDSLSSPLWDWVAVVEWMPGNRINLGGHISAGAAKKAVDSELRGIELYCAAKGQPFATPVDALQHVATTPKGCSCDYCRGRSDETPGDVAADLEGIVDE
jgi:hypothetical protein